MIGLIPGATKVPAVAYTIYILRSDAVAMSVTIALVRAIVLLFPAL